MLDLLTISMLKDNVLCKKTALSVKQGHFFVRCINAILYTKTTVSAKSAMQKSASVILYR